MRKSINAIINVIRSENRSNRVEALAARGVDALRASGPADMHQCDAYHAGQFGPFVGPRGGLQVRLDQRSSLNASSAWQSLSQPTGKRPASQLPAEPCFTATCTATLERSQASGRLERRAGISAARGLASV